MTPRLQSLRNSVEAKKAEFEAIYAKPDRTEADNTKALSIVGEVEVLTRDIETETKLEAGRKTMEAWVVTPATPLPFGADRKDAKGGNAGDVNDKGGVKAGQFITLEEAPQPMKIFGSASGFFRAVKDNANGVTDGVEKINAWHQMQIKAPAGMFEAADPDGGILVLPETSTTIYDRAVQDDNYLSKADVLPVRGNAMSLPRLDDAARTAGSRFGGVQSYWAGEAGAFTGSRPKFGNMELKLHKLTVLVYLTSELVDDSPFAIEAYVSKLAAKEIRFRTCDAMINGSGDGTPRGVVSSQSQGTVAVTKATNQAAATVIIDNIELMYRTLNIASRTRNTTEWLFNIDLTDQLNLLAFPVGTGGVPAFAPIFQPSGGINNKPYDTLKGLPLRPSEFCQAAGTPGDIILIDWSEVQAITKGAVNTAMSMHVKFLTDELAYRFTFRMDSQLKWDKPLTPLYGVTKTSPCVLIAQR